MTTYSKAFELVEKYKNVRWDIDPDTAKQCALIAIEEIIIEYRVLMIETAFCYDQFKYWQQVKTEIEEL